MMVVKRLSPHDATTTVTILFLSFEGHHSSLTLLLPDDRLFSPHTQVLSQLTKKTGKRGKMRKG